MLRFQKIYVRFSNYIVKGYHKNSKVLTFSAFHFLTATSPALFLVVKNAQSRSISNGTQLKRVPVKCLPFFSLSLNQIHQRRQLEATERLSKGSCEGVTLLITIPIQVPKCHQSFLFCFPLLTCGQLQ